MDESATTAPLAAARDRIIDRPRLTSLLAESGARIILLAAPAGYGKTTLARQWSALQTGPVAWYRTTHASADVAVLAVGLDNVLAAATSPPGRDPNRIAAIASANARPAPLARALVSTYRGLDDVLLIVDEYEAARTAEADELMGLVVEGLDLRVVVTSRTRPDWLRGRRAVYGEIFEIGVEELTMTDEEALEVLSRDRSPEDARMLLGTARGWPAVIGLAAMGAAGSFGAPPLPPRPLYDFIAGELLDSSPAGVADGLTLLATASVADVPTAEIVLGERTGSILGEAHRRGLVHLEDDRMLSLHPLLSDLLLARLRERKDPRRGLIDDLRPLIDAGRWDEALATAEAVPDPDFVTLALARALPELLRGGRVTTLRRWATVGRQAEADNGLVAYAEAEVALRDADFARAIALGENAAERLTGDLQARAHVVVAQAASLTDRTALAQTHLETGERLAESPETRVAALWGRFNLALDSQRDDARELLVTFLSAAGPGAESRLRAANGRMALALLDGGLHESLEEAEIAAANLRPDLDPMIRSSFLNAYAYALALTAQYGHSLTTAANEEALANEYELAFVSRFALMNQARALIGLRKFGLAARVLGRVEAQLGQAVDPYFEAHSYMYQARLCLCTGDFERAHETLVLEPNRRLTAGPRADYWAHRGLALAAMDRSREAMKCVEAAREISHFQETLALTEVVEAIATLNDSRWQTIDSYDAAVDSEIFDAIVLGLRVSPMLGALVARSADRRPLLIKLLVASNDGALARRIGVPLPRSTQRTSPLTPRELEVHELIAQGRTNREIASALYISESTAKLHVRHIFEKLGVRSRIEAVRMWQRPDDEG